MKIFISWSGEFSQKVASALKEWLPCVIQSIEVFYSTDDIEKGEKWDIKISGELSECKFGIVCLTNQNVNAPWIHFEAGALSKTLDSKVSALMLNVNPSDIKGPLSRFQATKFVKDDFYKLLQTINSNNDTKLDEVILKRTFDAMWEKINAQINDLLKEYNSVIKDEKKMPESKENNEAIEEILQILREQSNILSNPERLLPLDYFEYINRNTSAKQQESLQSTEEMYHELYKYLSYALNESKKLGCTDYLRDIEFIEILNIIERNIGRRADKRSQGQWGKRFRVLRDKYKEGFELSSMDQIELVSVANN